MTKHIPQVVFSSALENIKLQLKENWPVWNIIETIETYEKNTEAYYFDDEIVELYVLRDYDGGDGRGNRTNGLVTKNKNVAEGWNKHCNGNSYDTVKGVLIGNLSDIKNAQDKILRQKALDRLTAEEKRVLGLL